MRLGFDATNTRKYVRISRTCMGRRTIRWQKKTDYDNVYDKIVDQIKMQQM